MMMLPTGARNIQIHFNSHQNVSLSVKERQTNLMVHQSQQSWNRSVFITEGFCIYIFAAIFVLFLREKNFFLQVQNLITAKKMISQKILIQKGHCLGP